MSIFLGYTRENDNAEVVIADYQSTTEAEQAIQSLEIKGVLDYWLASAVNPETNEPIIFAYIDA